MAASGPDVGQPRTGTTAKIMRRVLLRSEVPGCGATGEQGGKSGSSGKPETWECRSCERDTSTGVPPHPRLAITPPGHSSAVAVAREHALSIQPP
jgi:hypothetical protein